MNFLLTCAAVLSLMTGTGPSNFHEGYPSAREASKKTGKDMLIYFSGPDCEDCEKAWQGFIKDLASQEKYISTRMDKSDFDGGVFYEMLGLEELPAWIIFNSDGIEKERWNGAWKNDGHFISSENAQSSTPVTNMTADKKFDKMSAEKATSAIKKSTELSESQNQFFIQAGYFGSEVNAKKLLTDLQSKGYSMFELMPIQQNGSVFYRVLSIPYSTETEANNANKSLMSDGFKGTVKKSSEIR